MLSGFQKLSMFSLYVHRKSDTPICTLLKEERKEEKEERNEKRERQQEERGGKKDKERVCSKEAVTL